MNTRAGNNRKAKQKTVKLKSHQRRRELQLLDRTIQDCVICLEKVTERGILSVCDHWFCFTCILAWSKVTDI